MAVIDELLVALGFDYDDEGISDFREDVESTIGTVTQFAKAAVGAATALAGMTVASTIASDEQGKLANEIGISVEDLSALQFAAQRAGASAEGMASSLRGLSSVASEAALGMGTGVEAFGRLGISVRDTNGQLKPASRLITEVSGAMQGLSRAEQIELASKLGLQDSIRLLQEGPTAIRELTGEARALGVTTAEDAEVAADFQDSLTDLWSIMKDVSRLVAKVLAPVMDDIIETFTEWWKVNRQLIESKLPEFVDKVILGLKLLSIATAAWIGFKLASHIIQLTTLMRGLSISILATQASALAIPALIGAVVAAIALLVEDAKVFFEGGDSFLGSMIEKFPRLNKILIPITSAFATLAELITTSVEGLRLLTQTDFSFEGFKAFGRGITSDIKGLFGFEDSSEIAPNTSNNNSVSVDTLNITVPGAGDPQAVVAEIQRTLFQQANQDLDTGVAL